MKKTSTALLLATLIAGPVTAGVVYEIEVTDHEKSPPKSKTIEAAVQGRNLKMGTAQGHPSSSRGDMIFLGDRREMVVVDHEDKSYHVMDEATMGQIAGQVGGAMAQMQEALKNVPADKRAMVEQMMKQQMPQETATSPRSELKKTTERADKNGYPCVKYEVYQGDRKLRQMWVTDWSNIEGGSEAADAFEDMAGFFREMMDAIPDFGQGPAGSDNAFELIDEMGGFPVVTEEFGKDGGLEGTSTLRSARRQTLDPAAFEPPAGYKRRSMFGS